MGFRLFSAYQDSHEDFHGDLKFLRSRWRSRELWVVGAAACFATLKLAEVLRSTDPAPPALLNILVTAAPTE